MTILNNWNLILTEDDVLRGQAADPRVVRARKPLLLAAAERALAEGFHLIHPLALTREIGVREHRHERIRLESGTELTGPLVTRQLGGAQRAIAAVCTIGPELEEAVTHLFGEDPRYALALDGLGNATVDLLAQQVCQRIADQVALEGLTASTPLSPGSPEWPVEIGQPQIFALLDSSQIEVSLTSGGMMLPKKTVSFVVGIGPQMAQTDACQVCSLEATCRYRHA